MREIQAIGNIKKTIGQNDEWVLIHDGKEYKMFTKAGAVGTSSSNTMLLGTKEELQIVIDNLGLTDIKIRLDAEIKAKIEALQNNK